MDISTKNAIITGVFTICGSLITALVTRSVVTNNYETQNTEIENNIVDSGIEVNSEDSVIIQVNQLINEYNTSTNTIVTLTNEKADLISKNDALENDKATLETQLKEMQLQVENLTSAEVTNEIIQQATNYWNNFQFLQALILLKHNKLKSTDIDLLYKQYSDEYVLYLLSQSELLISDRKYDEAINLLEEGKSIVYDFQMLNDKINEINDNQPIKLSDLKISASRFFSQNQDRPIEDTVGNKYSAGNSFITYAKGKSSYGYATFYLGKKYTSLNGIVAVSDESENSSDEQLKGWIEIGTKNGDGFNPLWSSQTLSRITIPEEIPELDLSDTEWLEIRYYNNGEYGSVVAGYHSLRVIISDVMIYSD
ncbi:MAG: hypothetical protein HFJ12_06105 [Bacilli bacterium]|nr:hypothetical protein [Bacilli bacterium]